MAPFLGLVACLDGCDMRRVSTLASSMVGRLKSKGENKSRLGSGQVSQWMQTLVEYREA
jgi:hypothetical protein